MRGVRVFDAIRWGIIGCGNVAEVKSGPAFQRAQGSSLIAVMRRNRAKAQDFARRHGVPRVHDSAAALIDDPDVDAVYIATPPSSHVELALRVAQSGKPCLVEKPMATSYDGCRRIVDAFRTAAVPVFVAYYRRALPRFLQVRDLLSAGEIGRITSVHVQVHQRLATSEEAQNWRFDPAVSGGGLFVDLGSHCVDLVEFLVGRIERVSGFATNTAAAYGAEDLVVAAFECEGNVPGTGVWNFNAAFPADVIVFSGTAGALRVPVFTDGDVVLTTAGSDRVFAVRNPPHVHQPLVQSIVDELRGRGRCESRGDSGARASWVLDQCLELWRTRNHASSPA